MIMDESVREDMRRFIDRWRIAGPALQEQRMDELLSLSDERALRMTHELFSLWRPQEHDDYGAELVEQQRVFRKLGARSPTPR
jgi:hypothetical protein